MSKGTVKFFNETKGFGFITEEGVEEKSFCTRNRIDRRDQRRRRSII